MNYLEFTNKLLFKYHKDIQYVFKVVGEIYHNSNGLINTFLRKSMLDNECYYIGFNSEINKWVIEKLSKNN